MKYRYTITGEAEVSNTIDGLESLLSRVKKAMRLVKSDLPEMVIHPIEAVIPDGVIRCTGDDIFPTLKADADGGDEANDG